MPAKTREGERSSRATSRACAAAASDCRRCSTAPSRFGACSSCAGRSATASAAPGRHPYRHPLPGAAVPTGRLSRPGLRRRPLPDQLGAAPRGGEPAAVATDARRAGAVGDRCRAALREGQAAPNQTCLRLTLAAFEGFGVRGEAVAMPAVVGGDHRDEAPARHGQRLVQRCADAAVGGVAIKRADGMCLAS